MRMGVACFSVARRMLANGGGSSSGMNSPTSSCRRPLPDAEEFEGLLLELGKPGHWSAGSLANRRGGLPASGGLLGLLSAPARRLGGGVDPPCRGGCPSASFLRLPLPRDLGWAPPASSTWSHCLIFQLQLEGCTTQCCALWQRGTVTGFLLIRQGGLVARMGLRASLRRRAVRVVHLEDVVANGRISWPVFQHPRKIPRSRRRRGVLG